MKLNTSPIQLIVEEGLLFYSKRAGDFCLPEPQLTAIGGHVLDGGTPCRKRGCRRDQPTTVRSNNLGDMSQIRHYSWKPNRKRFVERKRKCFRHLRGNA